MYVCYDDDYLCWKIYVMYWLYFNSLSMLKQIRQSINLVSNIKLLKKRISWGIILSVWVYNKNIIIIKKFKIEILYLFIKNNAGQEDKVYCCNSNCAKYYPSGYLCGSAGGCSVRCWWLHDMLLNTMWRGWFGCYWTRFTYSWWTVFS